MEPRHCFCRLLRALSANCSLRSLSPLPLQVPGFKPWPALLMLNTWLTGASWPTIPVP